MKAIETRYKGYRFRSRLEARWAVFFDALKASWEYEPEGFYTGGAPYLPDFRIPINISVVFDKNELTNRQDRVEGLAEVINQRVSCSAWKPVSEESRDLSGVHIGVFDNAITAFFEIKPMADPDMKEIHSKIMPFVVAAETPLIMTMGDPYDMHLVSLMGDGDPSTFSFGHVVVLHSAPFGLARPGLPILLQGAGCDKEMFVRVASHYRPAILPAAISARSARFEHGETPR